MNIEEITQLTGLTEREVFEGFLTANTVYHAAFSGAPITFMADFIDQAVNQDIPIKAILLPILSDMGSLMKNPEHVECMQKTASSVVRNIALDAGLSPDDYPHFYNGA